jgi:DNA invertase Pin-like site-specific DNA recombinase
MNHRVIGYIRVSTEEQADSGAGLAAQRAAITTEAHHRGWSHLEVIEDAGASGSDLKRPGITTALAALAAGRANVLMVSKLDRLSRSLVDFAHLMERSRKEGWALVALDLGVDTSTPTGEVMAGVLALFAQFERRLIGQRTREALAVKKAQGVRLGRPPVVQPAVIARVRAERARGFTYAAIAAGLNAEAVPTAHGGERWHKSTVAGLAGEPPRPRRRPRRVRAAA